MKNEKTMHVIAPGTGDAFSALKYSSCLAVEADDRWLLIDAPHPIRKMLREAGETAALSHPLDLHLFEGAVLTHLHADHASGLEGLGFFNHFALQRKARVLTDPAVREELWSGHLRAGMRQLMHGPEAEPVSYTLGDFFELVDLYEREPYVLGPFTIETHRTVHHIPTIAVKVRANGVTLGYSADTAFREELIEWLSDADLIIHETNFGGAHTPYEKLAALPEALRAKMRLIAYPDSFDEASSVITTMRQGARLDVRTGEIVSGER